MKVSIIIPVYNEEKLISGCLDALINQNYSKEDYEIIVVNDGSTDDTLLVAQAKQKKADEKGVSINIVNLEMNRGRAIARETGAKNTRYENLLFVDSRCVADDNILKKLSEINYEPIVGNPVIDFKRSAADRFNWLIRKKLYHGFFGKNFESFYITSDNFDAVPKGTTVFFCNRELFLSSQPENMGKNISDDTKLLWNIVQKKKMLKHPDIKVTYQSRTSLGELIKHTFLRGPKFIDYYLNPKKKYFWFFIAPSIIIFSAIIFILIKPVYFIYFLAIIILIWVLASLWLAENTKDFAIALILLPLFMVSFWAGIFYGLTLKAYNTI